jgi:hypothetical protein
VFGLAQERSPGLTGREDGSACRDMIPCLFTVFLFLESIFFFFFF